MLNDDIDRLYDRLNHIDESLDKLVASHAELAAFHTACRKEVIGNGQPGRIQIIESRMDRAERMIWIAFGIVVAFDTMIPVAIAKGWLR